MDNLKALKYVVDTKIYLLTDELLTKNAEDYLKELNKSKMNSNEDKDWNSEQFNMVRIVFVLYVFIILTQ